MRGLLERFAELLTREFPATRSEAEFQVAYDAWLAEKDALVAETYAALNPPRCGHGRTLGHGYTCMQCRFESRIV